MNLLYRVLKPPEFENEFKSQQAYMLHVILWTLVLVPLPYLAYTLMFNRADLARALLQTFFGESANIVLLILLHKGWVKQASAVQVSLLWFFFAATAWTGGGVQGEAYLAGFALVIIIAGILLGWRGTLVFTFLSLGLGALLIERYMQGRLPTGFESAPPTTWIVSLVLFPAIAFLQRLSASRVQRALERARASEEKYRLISAVSSDYVFSTPVEADGTLRLEWVAGAFTTLTGYKTLEEYRASGGWTAHLHPEDIAIDNQVFQDLQSRQQTTHEVRTYRKDGSLRWVKVYAHPVWDEENNRLKAIIGAVQDVTERKQIEQERETLIRKLEIQNAELERFTYTVSHDLKAPLVTITGFLGFLEKDAQSGDHERLHSGIERISHAAKKMQALLNDLLELSRVGRLLNPPEDVPFLEIVNEAIERLRGRLDAIHAVVEIQRDLPMVRGDRTRLIEVVQNLVDNAAKYARPEERAQIQIGASGINDHGYPIFFVRDNGIGIEPQYHERIFGLFNKLDPNTEGTGIGLSLVKRIVETHNGHIWVESEKGKGSTFRFSLPVPAAKE
jgi:PAS domain S-box-containing protein